MPRGAPARTRTSCLGERHARLAWQATAQGPATTLSCPSRLVLARRGGTAPAAGLVRQRESLLSGGAALSGRGDAGDRHALPVDGLHLDYIRFPNEWNSSYPQGAKVPDYPRDPRTLALFRQATGRTPEQAPAAWDDWRTAQVTQLLREIRSTLQHARPGVALSAAVGADPALARRTHFQDARRWMAERLVDAVFPMNYTTDSKLFNQRMQLWGSAPTSVRVVPGLSLEHRSAATVAQQLTAARRYRPDVCLFAYSLLFGQPQEDGNRPSPEHAELRRTLSPYLKRP